jgi:hypothetical protein
MLYPPITREGANDGTIDAIVSGMQDMGVSRDTLLKLAKEGQVDSFPLARPSPASQQQGVSFYVDELGQAKGLLRNNRAAALAAFCGFKQVPLLGDVMVARHALVWAGEPQQGGRTYRALDFTEKELDSSAAWVKDCEASNYEHGVQVQSYMHTRAHARSFEHFLANRPSAVLPPCCCGSSSFSSSFSSSSHGHTKTGMVSMDPDAAATAASSQPTFVSVDGGSADHTVAPTTGLASQSTAVEHCRYQLPNCLVWTLFIPQPCANSYPDVNYAK